MENRIYVHSIFTTLTLKILDRASVDDKPPLELD
ncbi:hypothetical protein DFO62_1029 [Serratia fonticola]|nr:hypothetical protein DFO62_1029 [Serratia fonticola]